MGRLKHVGSDLTNVAHATAYLTELEDLYEVDRAVDVGTDRRRPERLSTPPDALSQVRHLFGRVEDICRQGGRDLSQLLRIHAFATDAEAASAVDDVLQDLGRRTLPGRDHLIPTSPVEQTGARGNHSSRRARPQGT